MPLVDIDAVSIQCAGCRKFIQHPDGCLPATDVRDALFVRRTEVSEWVDECEWKEVRKEYYCHDCHTTWCMSEACEHEIDLVKGDKCPKCGQVFEGLGE